ncbi:amidohydrolase family protein, partial [Arthrospira platensis SPKY1]|nr:amidohydrolase family protein [Arthrospira platensis SPKY1]
ILSPDASVKYMIPGFNMITEMELLQKAALSPFAILQMATSNFATFFNGNYGELRVGKDADFIVLNDNPLENLKTLRNIQGLYYQDHYLSTADLELLKKQLKEAIKDK